MLVTFELIVSLGFLHESGGMAQIDPPKTRMWIYERIQSILRICKLQIHASYPVPAREVPSPLFEEAVYPFIDDPVIPSTIRVSRAVESDPTMPQGTNYNVRTVRRMVI